MCCRKRVRTRIRRIVRIKADRLRAMKVKRRADLLVESTWNLFRETLLGGLESDVPWRAIRRLHRRGSRLVFDRAKEWCHSSCPLKRSRAASILAQLHRLRRSAKEPWDEGLIFRVESFELISNMLKEEPNDDALSSEISALGHIANADAVPLLVSFDGHASSEVRFSVACALGSFHAVPEALASLMRLMEDEDREIRDWAIFGAGTQGDADSPELRAAFFEHLDDPYFEARAEAAAALAKRQDLRVVAPLIEMFERCLYMPISLTRAAEELFEPGVSTRYWDAKDFVTALKTVYPEQEATAAATLLPQ